MMFDALIATLTTGHRPASGISTLQNETVVAASLADTFAFFASAANLERLTPPWINFRIRTALPIEMKEGAVIDYQIVLYGLPIPWRTCIDVWQPGVRFVDRQLAGPYRWWHHEHRFERDGHNTRVFDRVEYLPRAAWLSTRLVRRDLERIFAFRQAALRQQLGSEDRSGGGALQGHAS
jgi:ligand-binding SRPBCC domain-containing protein